MLKEWYIYKNDQQEGPFTWGELFKQRSSGALTPSDLVWKEGMSGWCHADQVEGLFNNISSQPSSPPSSLGAGPSKKGKGLLIAAVIIFVVTLLGGGILIFNLLSPGNDEGAVEGEVTSERSTSLSVSEQRSLAVELFNEIAEMDMWELEEMEQLYFQIMNEAPDTEIAQESYWYLSNMYMQAFSPGRYDDAIELLETYLELYPGSTLLDEKYSQFAQHGFPVVENRLLRLYDEVRDNEKSAELYLELIPDPAETPNNQLDHLLSYGLSMEKVGRIDEAIIAYQTYLDRKEDPPSFMVEMAEGRLQELGVDY